MALDDNPTGKLVSYQLAPAAVDSAGNVYVASTRQTRVSNISADTGTASILMGACSQDPGTAGIENGLECNRSADVWGIALTTNCNLSNQLAGS